MPTPVESLRRALAADPARPLVTFYDGATGERVELSVATFGNWVAKTANLLQDGLGAEPGQRLALLLPVHWLAPVWFLAAWSTGLVVAPGGEPGTAHVVVSGPDDLERAVAAGTGEVVALSLRPLGGRFLAPLPPGVLDYGAEVAGYGDRFTAYTSVDPDAPALELPARVETHASLGRLDFGGLAAGARILATLPLDGWAGCVTGIIAPLAVGGSVVLARNLPAGSHVRLVGSERVTAVAEPGLAVEAAAPPVRIPS